MYLIFYSDLCGQDIVCCPLFSKGNPCQAKWKHTMLALKTFNQYQLYTYVQFCDFLFNLPVSIYMTSHISFTYRQTFRKHHPKWSPMRGKTILGQNLASIA